MCNYIYNTYSTQGDRHYVVSNKYIFILYNYTYQQELKYIALGI